MNKEQLADYSVELMEIVRQCGISDIKIEHRHKELDYFQFLLKAPSEIAVQLLSATKWHQFECRVEDLLAKYKVGLEEYDICKEWNIWSSKAMMEAYDENEVFNVQSVTIRFYETYRHYLYIIAKSKGFLVDDHTSADQIMEKLSFDNEAILVARFLRKFRNDIVHNRGIINQKTFQAYAKIAYLNLFEDPIYANKSIRISIKSYSQLFVWLHLKFDSYFGLKEEELIKAFQKNQNEKYPVKARKAS